MIPRTAASTLLRLAKGFPVLAITGPRQTGKTTLARSTFPGKPCLSLEDPDIRALAAEDPRGLLSRYPAGAILDEVQRVPKILSYLQTQVDAHPQPGAFVLTGSQHLDLSSALTQSLAGRMGLLNLLSFSLGELQSAGDLLENLDDLLWRGLYPPLVTKPAASGDRGRGEVEHSDVHEVQDLASFYPDQENLPQNQGGWLGNSLRPGFLEQLLFSNLKQGKTEKPLRPHNESEIRARMRPGGLRPKTLHAIATTVSTM